MGRKGGMVADWVAVAGQVNASTYGWRLVRGALDEVCGVAVGDAGKENNYPFALLDAVGEALLLPVCSGSIRNREAALLWRVSIWI